MNRPIGMTLAALLLLLATQAAAVDLVPARPASPDARPDSMVFVPEPAPGDSENVEHGLPVHVREDGDVDGWRHLPFSGALLLPPEMWLARHPKHANDVDLDVDYNRVDLLRLGIVAQFQRPETIAPRLALAYSYAFGRDRALYGVQFEEPLQQTARVVFGLDAERRTDHGDLQQLGDAENTALLLFAHEDWRDYFEREGQGAYLSWRVPDFSTVSVHVRHDTWRSLPRRRHVESWFRNGRALRANPAIDDGETQSLLLRFDRLAHDTPRSRGGVYHWIEGETAGHGMGGDFDYARVLGDVRSVVRLTPGASLAMRVAGGSALRGTLPKQREFVLGGVDGLRGHPFASFRGDRMALGQIEASMGLDPLGKHGGDDLQLLAFVDTGTAWQHDVGGELAQQRFALDGGLGLATGDDDLRVTVARDLRSKGRGAVVAVRLQRPF